MVGAAGLLAACPDLPRHEAERLLAAAAGVSRTAMFLAVDFDADIRKRFAAFVDRRRHGEPLQYIEGTVQFGPVELLSDARALIPRPETEYLWEVAARECGWRGDGAGRIVVDLCTGSGNLALALKHRFPGAMVYATDVSAQALDLASANALYTGLTVEWLRGDLFAPLPARLRSRVGLIVANPPYLAEDELSELPAEVRDHEPRVALVAGPTGGEVVARIATEAAAWLAEDGVLVCEIGERQRTPAEEAFAGWAVEVVRDLTGRDRVVVARPG